MSPSLSTTYGVLMHDADTDIVLLDDGRAAPAIGQRLPMTGTVGILR